MPTVEKISDWICMCASGMSIEGEPITDAMIQEVADRYDPSFYTAMIWPHHPWPETGGMLAREMYTYNLGRVAELKAEPQDGVLKLFARYIPNKFLLELNEMDQKLFSSAEFWLNFQNEGYPYLVGVTATDIPASTHTEIMRFSAKDKRTDFSRGEFMQFSIGKLADNSPQKLSIFDRLFSSKKSQKSLSQSDIPNEEQEKMDELKDLIQSLLARIAALEAAATGETTDTPTEATEEVQAQAEEIVVLAEEVATLAEEVVAAPEDEVVAAEFTAARADLTAKLKAFSAGDPHFAARRRRALRAFSAARSSKAHAQQGSDDVKTMRNDLNELKQMLSAATSTTTTKRPGPAPAGAEKKPIL